MIGRVHGFLHSAYRGRAHPYRLYKHSSQMLKSSKPTAEKRSGNDLERARRILKEAIGIDSHIDTLQLSNAI